MAKKHKQHSVALSVECLEARELLATSVAPSVISRESFDSTLLGLLPRGWSQWSNPGSFHGAAARGFNRTNGYSSSGVTSQTSRAWNNRVFGTDVRATADVFLDSNRLIPGQVLVRGSSLDTSVPSYYAVSVTRGLNLELIRVVNGSPTVLARLTSTSTRYISNQWVRVSLEARGSSLKVQVQRLDTNEYLASNGRWQKGVATAITKTDARTTANPRAITGGGFVGLNRVKGFNGEAYYDNFQAAGLPSGSPSVRQSFDQTPANAIPADWSQWSDDGPFGVSKAMPRSGTGGLMAEGVQRANARVWMDVPAPANSQVSANILLNSLAGSSIFRCGKNLGTNKPTY
jgi:hypothetical protein